MSSKVINFRIMREYILYIFQVLTVELYPIFEALIDCNNYQELLAYEFFIALEVGIIVYILNYRLLLTKRSPYNLMSAKRIRVTFVRMQTLFLLSMSCSLIITVMYMHCYE